MHLSATAKALIMVTLIVIGVYVGAVLFFFNIKSVNDNAAQKTSDVSITQKRVSQFESRKEIISNNQQEMRQIRSYFVEPELEGTVGFLSEIESLASTTGATVTAQSVNRSAGATDRTQQLDLTVNTSGTWREVYHTVTLIENMPYNITISNAQLTQQGREQIPAPGTSTAARAGDIMWNATVDMSVTKRVSTTSATSSE